MGSQADLHLYSLWKEQQSGEHKNLMQGDQLLFTVLAIAIGLLACFWGYNLFRLVLSVGGFLLGAIMLGAAAANNGASDSAALAAAFIGGMVGLVIVNLAYYFGVFWIGVGWGASLTSV